MTTARDGLPHALARRKTQLRHKETGQIWLLVSLGHAYGTPGSTSYKRFPQWELESLDGAERFRIDGATPAEVRTNAAREFEATFECVEHDSWLGAGI